MIEKDNMGLFDVIHFPQPLICVACQVEITSTQTKAFDPSQNDFHVGDCVGHAEEMHIVRESLHCDTCLVYDQQFVYLVVYRGILVDVAADLETAEAKLHSFSFEKLILWYHDLSAKRDEVLLAVPGKTSLHCLVLFFHICFCFNTLL